MFDRLAVLASMCVLSSAAASAQPYEYQSTIGVRRVRGTRTEGDLHRTLMRHRLKVFRCHGALGGDVRLDVVVQADGSLQIERTRLSSRDEQASAGRCIERVLPTIPFGPAEGDTSLIIVIELNDGMPFRAPFPTDMALDGSSPVGE